MLRDNSPHAPLKTSVRQNAIASRNPSDVATQSEIGIHGLKASHARRPSDGAAQLDRVHGAGNGILVGAG